MYDERKKCDKIEVKKLMPTKDVLRLNSEKKKSGCFGVGKLTLRNNVLRMYTMH